MIWLRVRNGYLRLRTSEPKIAITKQRNYTVSLLPNQLIWSEKHYR